MDEDRYLFCRACGEVHHITPFDTAPIYLYAYGALEEIPADDCREFLERHRGHKVEELRSISENHFHGRISDPARVTYRRVTNGLEEFRLKTFRKSIAEPLRHVILPEQLNLWKEEERTEGLASLAARRNSSARRRG